MPGIIDPHGIECFELCRIGPSNLPIPCFTFGKGR
jgi:hypothetical protein